MVAGVAIIAFTALLVISLYICRLKKKNASLDSPRPLVVHTKVPVGPDDSDEDHKVPENNTNTQRK